MANQPLKYLMKLPKTLREYPVLKINFHSNQSKNSNDRITDHDQFNFLQKGQD